MTYDDENPVPGFGQLQQCGWIKAVHGIIKKPFQSKRPHTITHMNDNRNMNSTIAGSIHARS